MVERMRRTKPRKASMKGGANEMMSIQDIYKDKVFNETQPLPSPPRVQDMRIVEASSQQNTTGAANKAEKGPGGGDSEKPRGMSEAFAMVYKVCAIISILIVFIITIVAIIDYVTYLVEETSQKFKIKTDPYFVNNRSTDVKTLQYLLNNPSNEPYSVFMEQNLIVSLFIVIGFAVALFGIQIAIFLALKIYAAARSKPNDDKLSVPFVYMGILLISFVSSLVLTNVYTYDFVKGTQEAMRSIKTKMLDVKSFMYSNMSNDAELLDALKRDDQDKVIQIMQSKTGNLPTLKRMIMTYNIYQYFSKLISENNDNYDKMMQIFTYEGIQRRKVDPTMFLIYKQANQVTDGYTASLQNSLTLPAGNLVAKDIKDIVTDLNKRIIKIQDISIGKRNLGKYMLKFMVVCVIFLGILMLIIWFQLSKEYPDLMSKINVPLMKFLQLLMFWKWFQKKEESVKLSDN